MAEQSRAEAEHRTLRSLGLTLIGVVLSISVSVGFGMSGPWWLRLAVAGATGAGLVVLIKLSTNQGARGPITKLADWITGDAASRDG